jgi:hypothetical protein
VIPYSCPNATMLILVRGGLFVLFCLFTFLLFQNLPNYNAGLFSSHGSDDFLIEQLKFKYESLKDAFLDKKDFPHSIDIVYTWVNGSHPRQQRGRHLILYFIFYHNIL